MESLERLKAIDEERKAILQKAEKEFRDNLDKLVKDLEAGKAEFKKLFSKEYIEPTSKPASKVNEITKDEWDEVNRQLQAKEPVIKLLGRRSILINKMIEVLKKNPLVKNSYEELNKKLAELKASAKEEK